jgi:exopolysaccharide biosynthesis WecB/TagA/CpsF family protein
MQARERGTPRVANHPTGNEAFRLVNTDSEATLLAEVSRSIEADAGFAVATLNLDHIVKLRQSPEFQAIYARQTYVVADGNPVVWLLRLSGRRVDLVPGSALVRPLCALAARLGAPIAMVGSTDEALKEAAARLEADYPGLRVVLRLAPAFGFDPRGAEADQCLDAIKASGARLCFVAFGAPKQETLAARGLERVPGCGFISVGAGLDFIAGHQVRAPRWVQKIAMEWVWRLASNPRRLARRYWDCLTILPSLVIDARQTREQA